MENVLGKDYPYIANDDDLDVYDLVVKVDFLMSNRGGEL